MSETEPGKNLVVVVGICSITILETIALYKGFDGQLFGTAIGAITLIIGYAFGYQVGKKN